MAGRPSKFDSIYCEQARKLCLLGSTDVDLAAFFETSESTIQKWKVAHPEFLQAIKDGKQIADANVAQSLYAKALSGDSTACIFWLKNRQKHAWRERHEVDHSGKVSVDPIQLLLSQVEGSVLKPKSAA